MGGSGVSSLSAFSGDDIFSAPDEKSTSNLRGVMNADWPKRDFGVPGGSCDRGWEKRKGCELGSRKAGICFFPGDSKTRWGPVRSKIKLAMIMMGGVHGGRTFLLVVMLHAELIEG